MKTVIEIPSTEALPEACRRFLGAMGNHSIFAFFGEMGVSKTTFISALSRMLGVSSDLLRFSVILHCQRIPFRYHKPNHLPFRPLPPR